ncbi:MAG: hypothetical protein M3065_07640 [Actinomycetota bacterium]|nr:hypothetical protein [Actinomycetota bacterium]
MSDTRRTSAPARQQDREWQALERLLKDREELSAAAEQLRAKYGDSSELGRLSELAERRLAEAPPIRLSHGQRLLGVSNQTVRTWAREGVLDDFGGSPQRVGLQSVMHAKSVADELRAQGRSRDFMSVVLSRLEARALENDPKFRESVRQMRRGKRLPRPY